MTSRSLGSAPPAAIRERLRRGGLALDLGLARVSLRSDTAALARDLALAYRHFAWPPDDGWVDLHVSLRRPLGLRRWVAPQVSFVSDGKRPFAPFPADTALPLFEWGTNWLIGGRMHASLLFHAGVVERGGLALLMPAVPGSGKSTLTAALSLRGWRLLSDEFGALDPDSLRFAPVLKPVALKNESIGVIRRFEPSAPLGTEFPRTRKGTVAHLAALPEAVARVHESAAAGAIVLPQWQQGQRAAAQPLSPQAAFAALAFNAFNYAIMGEAGFRAVVQLVRRCPAWQLTYSDLDDAIGWIERHWPQVADRHADPRGGA